MGEIRSQLSVDLSQLRAQLAQVQAEQARTDARAAASERRAEAARRRVQEVDRDLVRVESKLRSFAKGAGRQIGAFALTELADAAVEGRASEVGSRLLERGLTQGLTLLPGGFVIAAIAQTLLSLNRKVEEKVERAERELREGRKGVLDAIHELNMKFKRQEEEFKLYVAEVELKVREETKELMYKTSQYVE